MAASVETDRIAEASQAAWEAGYQAARAEAEAAAAAEHAVARKALQEALLRAAQAAQGARAAAVATVAAEAAELAVELAEALLGRELHVCGELERDALARALRLAPTGEDLIVRLHPGHGLGEDELAGMLPGVGVRIVDDPAIERGGCVLEAGACRIDAQIGPAIARARALLATDESVAA